ncbi:zinc finger CW-type PWWP domain protein 1-like isoform X2 [Dreissena polymorpha]|uniref:zinc finger CW-type PWWP domain protein 1-like isoform X2 n=1 Tax=Dreissena polymorpha TaxID=45954 RepID=UPI00226542E1|nr:zinc finger CW-type PWWP domain protein 1-like isoform X2 [Dreissena polymorpha]
MESTKTVKKSSFKRPAFTAPTVKANGQEIPAQEKDNKNKDDIQKAEGAGLPTAEGADCASDDDNQVVPDQPQVSAQGDAALAASQQKTKHANRKEFKVTTKAPASLTKIPKEESSETSNEKNTKEKTPKEIPKEESSETSNEKRTKEKTPKESKPFKSLTDEEYDEIFSAVFEYVENLNMDEWKPKLTSPEKVRKLKKKKFSITVGKNAETEKDTSGCDQSVKTSSNDDKDKSLKKIESYKKDDKPKKVTQNINSGTEKIKDDDKPKKKKAKQRQKDQIKAVSVQKQVEPDNCSDKPNDVSVQKQVGPDNCSDKPNDVSVQEQVEPDDSSDKPDDDDLENVKEIDIFEDDDQSIASEEQNNVEVDINRNEVQLKNECTPVACVADTDALPVVHKKTKKIKKQEHLEPRKLPFQNPSATVSMVDQIKQIKANKVKASQKAPKLDDESQVPTKKSKLEENKIKKRKPEDSSKTREFKNNSSTKKISKKKKMMERDLNLAGTWVQCCSSSCQKWRHLPEVNDPTCVPENWTCSMNTREEYNSCSKPEESYDESNHIYTKVTEGSVVWAKMTGYPWWPAMVEIDPDAETYFSLEEEDSMTPSHYHVVFFDDRVSRCWVRAQHVLQFSADDQDISYTIPKKFQKEVAAAKKNALRALSCTLKERIELFGFAARFKGTWEHKLLKGKPKTAKKTTTSATVSLSANEDLDETTIDDVLDNADEILDNVEEMLESIDSQLDDSEDDPEFAPNELVVVERKRRQTGRNMNAESKKAKMSSPKKAENENDSDSDGCDHVSNFNSDDRVKEKSPAKKIKFDPEIFTMEMDHESESEAPAVLTSESTTNKVVNSKKKSSTGTKKTSLNKKAEPQSCVFDQSELSSMNIKAAEEDRTENKEKTSTVSENVTSKKMEVSSEKELVQGKCDEFTNVTQDSEENIDDEDEMDLFGLQTLEKVTTPVQLQEMNFRKDSDSELDLDDESMYDDNTGDSKLRERSDLYVPIVVHNEIPTTVPDDGNDSDPFDLIEE